MKKEELELKHEDGEERDPSSQVKDEKAEELYRMNKEVFEDLHSVMMQKSSFFEEQLKRELGKDEQ